MSTEPTRESALPLEWADVLDRVAQALARTEAEAARSEQALTTRFPESEIQVGEVGSPGVVAVSSAGLFARLDERLQQLDECVAQAGQAVEQVEAALQGSEAVLRRWLAEAEAVRGRLASRATSSVS